MPRRTPIREIQTEENSMDSPIRRSSRIAATTPTPNLGTQGGKVTIRRSSSSSDTSSGQPTKVTKRMSTVQENKEGETPKRSSRSSSKSPTTLLKEQNHKSTPTVVRTRRGSRSGTDDENNQISASTSSDPPRRLTRRNSMSSEKPPSLETDLPQPQKRLMRKRSASADSLDKIVESGEEKPASMETIQETADEERESGTQNSRQIINDIKTKSPVVVMERLKKNVIENDIERKEKQSKVEEENKSDGQKEETKEMKPDEKLLDNDLIIEENTLAFADDKVPEETKVPQIEENKTDTEETDIEVLNLNLRVEEVEKENLNSSGSSDKENSTANVIEKQLSDIKDKPVVLITSPVTSVLTVSEETRNQTTCSSPNTEEMLKNVAHSVTKRKSLEKDVPLNEEESPLCKPRKSVSPSFDSTPINDDQEIEINNMEIVKTSTVKESDIKKDEEEEEINVEDDVAIEPSEKVILSENDNTKKNSVSENLLEENTQKKNTDDSSKETGNVLTLQEAASKDECKVTENINDTVVKKSTGIDKETCEPSDATMNICLICIDSPKNDGNDQSENEEPVIVDSSEEGNSVAELKEGEKNDDNGEKVDNEVKEGGIDANLSKDIQETIKEAEDSKGKIIDEETNFEKSLEKNKIDDQKSNYIEETVATAEQSLIKNNAPDITTEIHQQTNEKSPDIEEKAIDVNNSLEKLCRNDDQKSNGDMKETDAVVEQPLVKSNTSDIKADIEQQSSEKSQNIQEEAIDANNSLEKMCKNDDQKSNGGMEETDALTEQPLLKSNASDITTEIQQHTNEKSSNIQEGAIDANNSLEEEADVPIEQFIVKNNASETSIIDRCSVSSETELNDQQATTDRNKSLDMETNEPISGKNEVEASTTKENTAIENKTPTITNPIHQETEQCIEDHFKQPEFYQKKEKKETPVESKTAINEKDSDENLKQPKGDSMKTISESDIKQVSNTKKTKTSSTQRSQEDDQISSVIDESELADINEFLNEIDNEDGSRKSDNDKRKRSIVKPTETVSSKKKMTSEDEELNKSKKRTSLKKGNKKHEKAQTSSHSDEDNETDEEERPINEFIDDMAEEVNTEVEDDVFETSNDIPCEGESINSSDTESEYEDDTYENNSFIDDEDNNELLSGNEDFLMESPEKKKRESAKQKEPKEGDKKYARIVSCDTSSSDNEDTENVLPKSNVLEPIIVEDENSKENENPNTMQNSNITEKEPTEIISLEEEQTSTMQKNITICVDSDSEDESINIKVDPNENREALNTSRRNSIRKSSINIQENISLQDIEDGDLSERITKVVEWFCNGIKVNNEMSGNISLNVSLDYIDSNNEGASSPRIEEVQTEQKKRKSTAPTDEILHTKIRKSTESKSPPSTKKRKSNELSEDIAVEVKGKDKTPSKGTTPSKKRKSLESSETKDDKLPSPTKLTENLNTSTSKATKSIVDENNDFIVTIETKSFSSDIKALTNPSEAGNDDFNVSIQNTTSEILPSIKASECSPIKRKNIYDDFTVNVEAKKGSLNTEPSKIVGDDFNISIRNKDTQILPSVESTEPVLKKKVSKKHAKTGDNITLQNEDKGPVSSISVTESLVSKKKNIVTGEKFSKKTKSSNELPPAKRKKSKYAEETSDITTNKSQKSDIQISEPSTSEWGKKKKKSNTTVVIDEIANSVEANIDDTEKAEKLFTKRNRKNIWSEMIGDEELNTEKGIKPVVSKKRQKKVLDENPPTVEKIKTKPNDKNKLAEELDESDVSEIGGKEQAKLPQKSDVIQMGKPSTSEWGKKRKKSKTVGVDEITDSLELVETNKDDTEKAEKLFIKKSHKNIPSEMIGDEESNTEKGIKPVVSKNKQKILNENLAIIEKTKTKPKDKEKDIAMVSAKEKAKLTKGKKGTGKECATQKILIDEESSSDIHTKIKNPRKQRKISDDGEEFKESVEIKLKPTSPQIKQLKVLHLDDWSENPELVVPSLSEVPQENQKQKILRKTKGKAPPKNLVIPSLNMDDSTWETEAILQEDIAVSNRMEIAKKKRNAGPASISSFHPRDFKNQMLHNMGRVNRKDAKILLRNKKLV